jgi:long-chain acyl-CoA synthetase
LTTTYDPKVLTLADLLERSHEKFKNQNCLGERKVVKIHKEEKVAHGEKKQWTYPEMSEYQWLTYEQFYNRALDFGSGLRALGLEPGDMLGFFEETRLDWVTAYFGCVVHNVTALTVYANLGKSALAYALNQGEVTCLLMNASQLDLVKSIAKEVPSLRTVIYFKDNSDFNIDSQANGLTFCSFDEVVQKGQGNNRREKTLPKPNDTAVIMYTSGSTGTPKGVVILHSNIISMAAAIKEYIDLRDDDLYLSYLPLAHILAFCIQCAALGVGVPAGFGSPRTLTDQSVKNCRGDLSELKPTIFVGVPSVFMRIKTAADTKVNRSKVVKMLFSVFYRLKTILLQVGAPTWLPDLLVFNKFKSQVGGRLRLMVSGGGALPASVQTWLSTVFGIPFIQGYGATEVAGAAAVQLQYNAKPGRVGPPLSCNEIKLVDLPEKNYTSQDKPFPRGEIWIRGPNVAAGYYKSEEQTRQAFVSGWFRTGDIAQWNSDGSLSVIDREKNLIKPPHGEYISLEVLETAYKSNPLFNNVLVYVDQHHNDCVAVVEVSKRALQDLAKANKVEVNSEETFVDSKEIRATVLKELMKTAKAQDLKSIETVRSVAVSTTEWTVDNELVTPTLKINRKKVIEYFQKAIDSMYDELEK